LIWWISTSGSNVWRRNASAASTGIDELLAAAQVRVVRDDDGVAAGARLGALRAERVPEALRHAAVERVEVRERDAWHDVVPEDHVPVAVAPERARGVLEAE
jgi:hypothetical protein